MRVGLLAAAAVLAVILAAVGALTAAPGPDRSDPAATRASVTPRVVPTPAPPRLERADVDRQDRVDRAHRRRESRALDARPLLSELPLELGPVTLDAAGLTHDGQRTIVELTGPDRATAERAYRQALEALGDAGGDYAPRWVP